MHGIQYCQTSRRSSERSRTATSRKSKPYLRLAGFGPESATRPSRHVHRQLLRSRQSQSRTGAVAIASLTKENKNSDKKLSDDSASPFFAGGSTYYDCAHFL